MDKGNAFYAHLKRRKGDGHKRLGWADPQTGEKFSTRLRPEPLGKLPSLQHRGDALRDGMALLWVGQPESKRIESN